MAETTPHFALPLLHAGQAAKELTHNEALMLIDSLFRGRAADILVSPDLVQSPAPGDLWIVADTASGDWTGRDGALALWTEGGWRFVPPRKGLSLYVEAEGCRYIYAAGWQAAPQLPALGASTTEDAGARALLSALVDALAGQGLVRAAT